MLIQNVKSAAQQEAGCLFDLRMKDGKIAAVGCGLAPEPGEKALDAHGLTILSAFIDPHCHWRTPGYEYKEDVATGSAAAAAGGYTFVNLMPNTKPVCSSAKIAHAVMDKAREIGLCDCNQCISITQNFDGKTLDHLLNLPPDLHFLSEDGNGVQENAVMARAFAIAAQRGLTIMSHAEDRTISPWDYRLAENIETVRNLHLAEYYGTRLHMCHVSTREAIEAIRTSRARGARVTCEVTPHHLWFDDTRSQYRVNPPIRKPEDVAALVEGIRDGTVQCIATDHAPHTEQDKANGAAGMVGLETAFAVCYTKLCREEGLPLELLSALMSAGPAALLDLPNKGRLMPGCDADVVLVDIDHLYTVRADRLHSKSKNCPYDGQSFYGKIKYTFKAGKMTYCDQEDAV
jgi:dihydroorotase